MNLGELAEHAEVEPSPTLEGWTPPPYLKFTVRILPPDEMARQLEKHGLPQGSAAFTAFTEIAGGRRDATVYLPQDYATTIGVFLHEIRHVAEGHWHAT